jgi:hypothetical protein
MPSFEFSRFRTNKLLQTHFAPQDQALG